MTCTQNHKDPSECLISDCAPIFFSVKPKKTWQNEFYELMTRKGETGPIFNHPDLRGKLYPETFIKIIEDKFKEWENNKIEPSKQRMTPDETFIQRLKILGLSIALGIMAYQTYLLVEISKKI